MKTEGRKPRASPKPPRSRNFNSRPATDAPDWFASAGLIVIMLTARPEPEMRAVFRGLLICPISPRRVVPLRSDRFTIGAPLPPGPIELVYGLGSLLFGGVGAA